MQTKQEKLNKRVLITFRSEEEKKEAQSHAKNKGLPLSTLVQQLIKADIDQVSNLDLANLREDIEKLKNRIDKLVK